ncbi:SDR family oxidoreductase [Cesiribacter sp. SM1]|uniref:SDR family oxidoreductase n=1 Tax=Cesiribacter sp. SM1 TaxID=2861196 RepID=UPI001CD51BDB|nr:SDR family oxidoreductase [Cesiribacter sp. SM1]
MNALFSVTDKVIVVTGATGVLGKEMTTFLAQAGARVGILSRNENKVADFVKELKDQGLQAFGLVADVLHKASLAEACKSVAQQWGKLDVLLNVAGGNMPGAVIRPDQSVIDLSTDDLKKVMELNYLGTVLPTQAFLPLMLQHNKGNIINISSVSAQKPLTRVMGYSSAKAAIDNYTQWMAVELARKHGEGFRVNAITPGFFLTEQNRTLLTNSDGNLTDRGKTIKEHTPMARFGEPSDLNGTLLWLCSDASRFVTGACVPVDGGFSAFSGV